MGIQDPALLDRDLAMVGFLAACLLAAASPDPYAIYARAQAVWRAQRYPATVNYVVHVRTRQGDRTDERHYNSRWFSGPDRIAVNPVSVEEREHPYLPPPGFDFSILGTHIAHVGGPNEGIGTNGDLIGVPELAPNYSFGISRYVPPPPPTPAQTVAHIRAQYHDPAPQKVAKLQQKYGVTTIALVVAASAVYRISLVGMEIVGDHSDYHLRLTPLVNPTRYRLRDVWIDSVTYDTDQLRTAGNFVDGGTSSVPWTVTFREFDGERYIDHEVTDEPIRRWFDWIEVSFEDYSAGAGSDYVRPAAGSPIREPQLPFVSR